MDRKTITCEKCKLPRVAEVYSRSATVCDSCFMEEGISTVIRREREEKALREKVPKKQKEVVCVKPSDPDEEVMKASDEALEILLRAYSLEELREKLDKPYRPLLTTNPLARWSSGERPPPVKVLRDICALVKKLKKEGVSLTRMQDQRIALSGALHEVDQQRVKEVFQLMTGVKEIPSE